MDINILLSTIVLVSFVVTVILAVGSYMAYKLRENRRPHSHISAPDAEPVFFERVVLPVAPRLPPGNERAHGE